MRNPAGRKAYRDFMMIPGNNPNPIWTKSPERAPSSASAYPTEETESKDKTRGKPVHSDESSESSSSDSSSSETDSEEERRKRKQKKKEKKEKKKLKKEKKHKKKSKKHQSSSSSYESPSESSESSESEHEATEHGGTILLCVCQLFELDVHRCFRLFRR
jgi:hypothetical protein